ncbi:MAG: class I SAM-dependent rRNA methyltransferase [Planctomycetes bacterium]|nr:class I SAM-dependent rRNA methyltransferase [Planctomycetota bacterium]
MTDSLQDITLKVQVHGRHPWFYRKMVRRPAAPIPAGSAVRVHDRNGRFVGLGFYNPRTELALRMLTRADGDPDRVLLDAIDGAIALRDDVLGLPRVTDGYRLVHAEGDRVPGLILDRLGDAIVAQVFALAAQQRIDAIGERLLSRWPAARLVLTVDATARKREGMEPVPPPPRVDTVVTEHGLEYAVSAGRGHKTGFFADQRDNRQVIRRLARGRAVLDLFCNAGGFALNAARGGAREVVAADLDEEAVAQAAANAERNRLRVRTEHGDAFDLLRDTRPGRFDLIVLDPPKWASGRDDVDAALARYADLNRLAFERAQPGAIVATFSCSGAVAEARFLAMLRDAAAAAGRDVRILLQGGAGPDHPVALECPESRYLKACVLEVSA